MKIVLISDSHGYIPDFRRLAPHLRDADLICHCGDGFSDGQKIAAYFNKPLKQVRGNCDGGAGEDVHIFEVGGKRLMLTHGHLFGVKNGLGHLLAHAQKNKVDMVFYGHTHRNSWDILEGVHLINPGNLISTPRQRESTLSLLTLDPDDFMLLPATLTA